jgi:hypothetical protein
MRCSILSLPLGLGLNFIINGEPVEAVPMAVEEPSVIAATSGAAKVVAAGGGFETSTTPNVMFGQIQLIGIGDGIPAAVEAAAAAITAAKPALIEEANTYCASMLARGGGVVDVTPRLVAHREGSGLEVPVAAGGLQLVVHIHVDVQASMGANLINTARKNAFFRAFLYSKFIILPRQARDKHRESTPKRRRISRIQVVEGISDTVFAIAADAAPSDNARCGVRILSNMCPERRARASFRVPATELSYKGFSGAEVGRRIVETWRFAFDDPYRAGDCMRERNARPFLNLFPFLCPFPFPFPFLFLFLFLLRNLRFAKTGSGHTAGKFNVKRRFYLSVTHNKGVMNGIDAVREKTTPFRSHQFMMQIDHLPRQALYTHRKQLLKKRGVSAGRGGNRTRLARSRGWSSRLFHRRAWERRICTPHFVPAPSLNIRT